MPQAKPVPQSESALKNVFEQKITVHPLVPLARAASVLRTDPILLKERLVSGQIKGEKRSDCDPDGQKNSWYIYASEFNRLLNDQLTKYENRISTEGLDQFFEARQEARMQRGAVDLFAAPPPVVADEATEKVVAEGAEKLALEGAEKVSTQAEALAEKTDLDVDASADYTGDVIHINFTNSQSDETDSTGGDTDNLDFQPETAYQLLSELATKLEAATYRNGYLEALIETQAEQIRLLPDLQAQASKTAALELELEQLRAKNQGFFTKLGAWFTGKTV